MEVVAPAAATDGLAAPPRPEAEKQMPTVLCCMCSLPIPPNPTSMCVLCIRTQVDITEGIATNLTMHQCRGCKRYLRPGWVECKLESRELMAVCLRKINGLKKVKLVDASWIWTEPHSRRLKLKLTVQKEVGNGAVLQQAMAVTFVVRNQQCESCAAAFTNNTWTAVVQVRQRVDHKRTFFYLEQLILKHSAHSQCTNIQTFRDGMDFYFTEKSHSARFVDFLEGVVPTKVKHSKKLVSADNHSNIFNFHYTYLVTLVPVCKDDLVLLPKRLAESHGSISRLVVAQRITSAVQFADPLTAQTADITEEKYWRYEFPSLLSSTRLIPYVVLGTEPLPDKSRPSAPRGHRIRKARMAEVELARECDLGRNDDRVTVVSHLGHILRAGDTVLGYDVSSANLPEGEATRDLRGSLPDVVLVRKVYPRNDDREGGGGGGAGKRDRHWKLGELEKDGGDGGGGGVSEKRDEAAAEKDYERFLQQLESDRDMRRQVNLYKSGIAAAAKPAAAAAEGGGEAMEDAEEMDEEEVRLEELLDGMTLDNAEAGPDGEGDLGAASASIFEAGAAPAPNADVLLLDEDPDL